MGFFNRHFFTTLWMEIYMMGYDWDTCWSIIVRLVIFQIYPILSEIYVGFLKTKFKWKILPPIFCCILISFKTFFMIYLRSYIRWYLDIIYNCPIIYLKKITWFCIKQLKVPGCGSHWMYLLPVHQTNHLILTIWWNLHCNNL
jgi:hypothetical protein